MEPLHVSCPVPGCRTPLLLRDVETRALRQHRTVASLVRFRMYGHLQQVHPVLSPRERSLLADVVRDKFLADHPNAQI